MDVQAREAVQVRDTHHGRHQLVHGCPSLRHGDVLLTESILLVRTSGRTGWVTPRLHSCRVRARSCADAPADLSACLADSSNVVLIAIVVHLAMSLLGGRRGPHDWVASTVVTAS